jgi:hypothetical protein
MSGLYELCTQKYSSSVLVVQSISVHESIYINQCVFECVFFARATSCLRGSAISFEEDFSKVRTVTIIFSQTNMFVDGRGPFRCSERKFGIFAFFVVSPTIKP